MKWRMEEAAKNQADLILFPEVQLTEFFPQYPGQDVSQYRTTIDSEIVDKFCMAAKENEIMAVPNLLLYENGKTYDASVFIRKDGTIGGVQAFQNSVAIAMCNRVGKEGNMEFCGESVIVDANGDVIEKADDREQMVYAEIELSDSGAIRRSRPYTNLRRPEWYR